jgi:glycosyltransferase involved in cell wall biosynthesis
MTKVTVVMAAYNAMPFLPDAVDSILKQTYPAWQMIVVNDGSTDGTADYLASIQDKRVQIVFQENQGQQAAANCGIALSQTDYIARMDADDVAEPTRLEKQVAFLDAHAQVGLVGSQIYRMGSKQNGLASTFPCDHQGIYQELIHNRHAMCNPTIMFRRALFNQIGGYWKHNIAEDWDMFLRIGEVAELANLDEPLLSYRFHTGSINGRRMFEAQLHNEFACELARRRAKNLPEIEYSEFKQSHRSSRWPFSWFFKMDCQSVAQYRQAVAEMYEGKKTRGGMRLGYAMLCSPKRTLDRVVRSIKHKTKSG